MEHDEHSAGMPLSDFQWEFLPEGRGFDNAFNAAFPARKIEQISRRLRSRWQASVKADDSKKEKFISQAWVSGAFACPDTIRTYQY